MRKKLTDLRWKEVNEMDYILYHFYDSDDALSIQKLLIRLTDETKSNSMFKYMIDESKIKQHLHTLAKYNLVTNSIDQYYTSQKGKILCEQGGLLMLWEKQKTQKNSMWISIFSAVVALLALLANIVFSIYKT